MSMIVKNWKLHIDHILYCSLAGGVMISGVWDMFSFPWPALIIGALAGIISVWNYNFLGKQVLKWRLFDTRGILHLHLIPGLFGGILSAIVISN